MVAFSHISLGLLSISGTYTGLSFQGARVNTRVVSTLPEFRVAITDLCGPPQHRSRAFIAAPLTCGKGRIGALLFCVPQGPNLILEADCRTTEGLARRLMPGAKIIFATAYFEYAVTAFELQVNDYIPKPYDPSHIRQILSQYEWSCPAQDDDFRIAISGSRRHTILLSLDDITYIESQGSGKRRVIHTVSAENSHCPLVNMGKNGATN